MHYCQIDRNGTVILLVFKSIRPSPVPGLVAVAEIGHFVPCPPLMWLVVKLAVAIPKHVFF